MATMAATTAATSAVNPIAGGKSNVLRNRPSGISSASPVLGLHSISTKGRVRCAAEEKSAGKNTPHLSSICAAASAMFSGPGPALVDERMSTEETGLPFKLSNNLLVWILLGVFSLIWAFYVTYTPSLDEDEDSGLSL